MKYQLTDDDREILDALAELPTLDEQTAGTVLFNRFGNLTRFWQHVNRLLDTEEALQYQPGLVNRLRRRRERRTRRPAA